MNLLNSVRRVTFIGCFYTFGYAVMIFYTIMVWMIPAWRKREWMLRFTRIICRSMPFLMKRIVGVDLRIEGRENIPNGPAIIASNHESAWEAYIFYALLSDPAYVAKQELAHVFLFGKLIGQLGTIFIDRNGGVGVLRHLGRDVAAALALGRQVVFFPEGTRAKRDSEIKLKEGVDFLHRLTQTPITPVTHDSGRAWYGDGAGESGNYITLRFHPPMSAEESDEKISERLSSIFRTARRGVDGEATDAPPALRHDGRSV